MKITKNKRNSLNSFYEDYIDPAKREYLILGGLIVLFSFTQEVFQNSNSNFLLGLILTLIFFMFIIIFYKTLFQIKEATTLSLGYGLFYWIFFFVFASLSFYEYGRSFNFSMGLIASMIFLIIIRDMKNIGIMLLVKKANNYFFKLMSYLLIILIIFFMFGAYNLIMVNQKEYPSKESLINLSLMSGKEIYAFTTSSLNSVFTTLMILLLFIEMIDPRLRKYHAHIKDFDSILIYKLYKNILNNIKEKLDNL